MKDLVSIIIPVYNVQEYIEKCLDSVIKQTYINTEIIIIDDGSTDMSGIICDRFADNNKDKRIKVIHQDTGGVSKARNKGLDKAEGEYVVFVDSDDYIESNYIKMLYKGIKQYDVDLSICAMNRLQSDGTLRCIAEGNNLSLSQEQITEQVLCNNNIGGYLWNKLYKLSIIKEHNISFDNDISIGEDMVFIAEYSLYCRGAVYINQPLYIYRYNCNSALQKMCTTQEFDKKKLSNLKASKKIAEIYNNTNSVKIKQAVAYRRVRTGMWVIFNTLKCGYFNSRMLKDIAGNNIKPYISYYNRSKYAKKAEKSASVIFAAAPCISWRVMYICLKHLPDRIVNKYLV